MKFDVIISPLRYQVINMRMRVTFLAVSLILVGIMVLGFTPRATAQTAGANRKTIWSGVYTDEQASRGQALYTSNCSRCHGDDLSGNFGNPLVGAEFMDKWREDSVESLLMFVKASMPPARNRTTPRVPLEDQTYLDIIGFVFRSNAFPLGTSELKADNVAAIRIEGRDGPRPLPGGALAIVVGCMVQRGNGWALTRGTEPVRTRTTEVTTTEEIKWAEAQPLGILNFGLTNIGYAGESFQPEEHKGHKMLIKGTLVRQPGAERIDLMAATMIDSTCQP